ncbi:MAG: TonB-dependent receptor [Reichenbachiella sp.]
MSLTHPRPLIFVILFFISFASWAQPRVNGQVMTGESGLSFANVLLLTSIDSSLVKGVVTDADGNFSLLVDHSGDFLLKVTSIGYRDKHQQLSLSNQDLNMGLLLLEENAEQLDEVVVQADKPLFEQKIDRTVINVQSSITSSAGTALDVLEKSPGVTLDRANNSLSLAGKQGVRIMINGKMSRMPLAAAVQMLNGMNAENIEKIELITTPPAKYEAEGDAGIINIVLKQTADKGTNGSVSVFGGYGEGEKYGGSLNFNHRNKKLNVFGNYSYRMNHTHQVNENDRRIIQESGQESFTETVSDRNPYTTTNNARLGFDYELGSKTVVGVLGTFYDSQWEMDAVNNSMVYSDEATSSDLILYTDEINATQYYVANVNLSHSFNDKHELSLEVDYIDFRSNNPTNYLQEYTDVDGTNGGNTNNEIRSSKVTPLTTWVPRLDYTYSVNDNLKVEFGGKAAFNDMTNDVQVDYLTNGVWVPDPELTRLAYLTEDIYAGYMSVDYKINESLTAKMGIRYEHTETLLDVEDEGNVVNRYYGSLFPSLFLGKKINNDNSWVISYSRRISRPTFNDIAPFVIFLDPYTFWTGNESLLPSITDAIKYEYNFKSFLVSLQYSHDKDAIVRFQPRIAEDGQTQLTSAENMDFRDVISLSLSLPFTVTDWWEMQYNITGNYTVTETNHLDAPVRVTAAAVTLNGSNSFKLQKGISFEISGFYGSPSYFGISKFDHYGAINLGAEKKLAKDRGTIRLTFTDTFNTRNFRGSTKVPEQNLDISRAFILESQILNVTYTLNFGNNKLKKMRNKSDSSQEEKQRLD